MDKSMQVSGMGERTREAYLRSMRLLVDHYDKSPDLITEDELLDYFIHRQNVTGWSPATMRICYSGVKFFFMHVLKKDWHLLAIAQARRERRLPAVLSREEIKTILSLVRPFHNYAYLMTVYSCGLRLQEGLFLEVSDIDGKRKMIHIHRGKGAKDRYVPLPESTYALLRRYWLMHRNPKLLFPAVGRGGQEGPHSTVPMSIEGVQGALRNAKRAAGITWGRQMQYHPHLHLIVPTGGLSPDRKMWLASRNNFYLPVRALSQIFKAIFKNEMAKKVIKTLAPSRAKAMAIAAPSP
ncbi:MAG: tyrosine-type recombinase/integrase [Smithellaceae bacterium]